MRNQKNVSDNTLRRIPKYLRKLEELQNEGKTRVSSSTLGKILGFTASQIRQDFNYFGAFGQQGYGYDIATLVDSLKTIMGVNNDYHGIMVGAGKMGMTLIENFNFESCGVRIIAAFDKKPELTGKEINGVPICSADKMLDYVRATPVDIAVLCVPRSVAQIAANELIGAGIKAIWNFTNEDVTLPSDIIVENIHFSDSLMTMNYYLTRSK